MELHDQRFQRAENWIVSADMIRRKFYSECVSNENNEEHVFDEVFHVVEE